MGIEAALFAGSTIHKTVRSDRQVKLEKKRAKEKIAAMEAEEKEEKKAEEQRRVDFFEAKRKRNLARKQRTQRTFAGMNKDFNINVMKQKLGQ